MYIMIPLMAIVCVISFVLTRRMQKTIVSDSSPFFFADDVLIINIGSIFSVQNSSIKCIELQYNPKAIKNKFYEIRIRIVKTDGNIKNIRYIGSSSAVQPQDMAVALRAHRIKCDVCMICRKENSLKRPETISQVESLFSVLSKYFEHYIDEVA